MIIIPILLLSFVAEAAAASRTVPAMNEVHAWEQVGQQPYEMTWTQREQNPHTVVDFEDLTGWTLELEGSTAGELRRSREQQMWGRHVAKMVFSAPDRQGRMIARPPKPVAIPDRFDSVELWAYGNHWEWERDKIDRAASVAILIADAQGKQFRIPLAELRWKQWWLIHRRLDADMQKSIAYPAYFTGVGLSTIGNVDPRDFFCDSLAFYQEELKPLQFAPQPRRNLKSWPGQIAGLNTGPGVLPFPTREQTILPVNFEKTYTVSAKQTGANEFQLRYAGRDATITYTYRPQTGDLGEITAQVGRNRAFRPLDGGGIRFAGVAKDERRTTSLVSASLSDDVVRAVFRDGSSEFEYELRLWQKSLILDVQSKERNASELSFGRATGVTSPRLISVPYLTYGSSDPRVLMTGTAADPTFTSIWFDWYRTNASEPYAAHNPQITANAAELNGGLRYLPLTNGERNPLYERIFVTVSPTYEETLPVIPNPPSLRQAESRPFVWTVAPRFDTFEQDHARSRMIRSFGLDRVMQHSHEITWRDEGESFTLRLKPAPQKGGEAGLQRYVASQKGMGWLQGVYTNYTDLATTNTNWSPDAVQREPDGSWRNAWMRCYALKPAKAVELDEYYARRIKEKYGVGMSYTDVHTAVSPWRYNDFDARVPGAGTMAASFYAYGQILLNDQRVYGPTQSEGTYQWLYAGLESGSYGWTYAPGNLVTDPLDVAFHLMQIHPLQTDYGMGDTSFYLHKIDPGWKTSQRRREYVDRLIAATIAYGNLGWLIREFEDEPFHTEAMARSYYMMQQLQQQYAFVRPAKIEYADRNGAMLTPSASHASGAIAGSRCTSSTRTGRRFS
ncbi:MAG TPA: hypothetical protein VN442_10495 [Bryobacteraceae bacterium]|nr:hypothetical protein [Bryobacteraceae bacterium]